MSDLEQIRADIQSTKTALAEAKLNGDRDLILMYGATLIEQQKKENILLARAGKRI